MIKRKEIELLSPAGSFSSLNVAIQGGADAVYFGINKLNMRSRAANNFTETDLPKMVELAKQNDIKLYMTVNTVIYDNEIDEMKYVIDKAQKTGVDAVIATDFATINYAGSVGMPMHLSTQCNVSNYSAVKYYSQFAEVIVLARELTLEQINYITNKISEDNLLAPSGKKLRIEAFIHGALCMAISGKCYLSLHEMQHSANKGECLQMCRRSYTVSDTQTGRQFEIKNKYIMSPEDLCTINFIDKILESGISILKIEGRGRSADYVKTVTQSYNQAISAVIDGTYGQEKVEQLTRKLGQVFNRGFWEGSYFGDTLGKWSNRYGSKASKKKVYIGKVTNYYGKIDVGEFLLHNDELHPGDDYMIIGPSSGVVEGKAEGIRIDNSDRDFSIKGELFTMPLKQKVRTNDKLYKIVDSDLVVSQDEHYNE